MYLSIYIYAQGVCGLPKLHSTLSKQNFWWVIVSLSEIAFYSHLKVLDEYHTKISCKILIRPANIISVLYQQKCGV